VESKDTQGGKGGEDLRKKKEKQKCMCKQTTRPRTLLVGARRSVRERNPTRKRELFDIREKNKKNKGTGSKKF